MDTFMNCTETKGGRTGLYLGSAAGVVTGGFAGAKLTERLVNRAIALKKNTCFATIIKHMDSVPHTYTGSANWLGNAVGIAATLGIAFACTYIGTKAGVAIEENTNKKQEWTT